MDKPQDGGNEPTEKYGRFFGVQDAGMMALVSAAEGQNGKEGR